MKYHRNAKAIKSPLDAAPWASLFLLLLLFILLKSLFFSPSGVYLSLPEANHTASPTNAYEMVFLDKNGHLHFENKTISEAAFEERLKAISATSSDWLTLFIQADQAADLHSLLSLQQIALRANITNVMVGAKPSYFQAAKEASKTSNQADEP